jgi:hypothetical protein
MNRAMEITVGAAVQGDEGFVGEVERIDVDPSARFAKRVAVRPRHEGGAARLVPATLLKAGPDGLRLHCTLKGFEEFPLADGQGR